MVTIYFVDVLFALLSQKVTTHNTGNIILNSYQNERKTTDRNLNPKNTVREIYLGRHATT